MRRMEADTTQVEGRPTREPVPFPAVNRPATLGESCVDRYLPPIGLDAPGGNALNVAAGLAAAGLPTAHVGAVGDDKAGRFVLAQAAGRGIDTTHVAVVPGGPTGLTTITVTPDGDRVFESEELGVSATFRPTDEAVELLKTRSWVHATGPAHIVDALKAVAAAGVPVSYDVYHPPRTERQHELAPLLAVAFLSAPAGDVGDAIHLARDAVDRGAHAAVVSRGRDGCLMLVDDEIVEQPAVPTQVVDTLGAGDALIAGVIVALLESVEPAVALERGVHAAAAACEHIGAWGRSAEPGAIRSQAPWGTP
jgi:fructoselysine 6-kinase